VFKNFFSVFLFISTIYFYLFQCLENLKATCLTNSLQFPIIIRGGSNMMCIFHFFLSLKFANFHYLEVEQEKVIMSFRISFDRYIILI